MIVPLKVNKIINTLNDAGYEAYAVGGCVRDSLLDREPEDWDITTNALPEEVQRLFRRTVPTGIQHGTVTVLDGKDSFEVTTYRVDGDYEDGRHPKEVTFVGSLEEDLKRRDFTINAMAYHPKEGLIDLFHGQQDLEKKILRAVGNPTERFTEDALRMLRALRFSAQLDFTVEAETKDAIRALAPTLSKVSAERIREELMKLIISDHPEKLLDAYDLGITDVFLPEFTACMKTEQHTEHHAYDVGRHTVKAMECIRADGLLRLTMLLHDIAKPVKKTTDADGTDHFKGHAQVSARMAEEILRRLKFDNATLKRASNLIYYHDLRFHEITADRVRKAAFLVGEEDFPLLFEVKRADTLAQSTYLRKEKLARIDRVEELYHEIKERGDCLSLKQLAVDGSDLMEAGIETGRLMGNVLYCMLRDVLKVPEHNTREFLLSDGSIRRFTAEARDLREKPGRNFDENHTVRL